LDLRYDVDPITKKTTNLRTRFISVTNASAGAIPDGSTNAIQDFLNAELYKAFPKKSKDLKKSYKIYFINESAGDGTPGSTSGLYGVAYDIPAPPKSVAVYAVGFADSTLAHETLHAMGLYHSFDTSGKHVFTQNLTDNIMDYSDIATPPIPVIQLWKWQWETTHANVEKE
jgi:hypothetical protein